jgi:putative toxin-antitoxin system antitoxin component (TIGR02293 family)
LKPQHLTPQALEAAIDEGLPRVAVLRVVARTGLTGLTRVALRRRLVSDAHLMRRAYLNPQESVRTAHVAQVIALAEALCENIGAARAFLKHPQPTLGGLTPLECALADCGVQRVEAYVAEMRRQRTH